MKATTVTIYKAHKWWPNPLFDTNFFGSFIDWKQQPNCRCLRLNVELEFTNSLTSILILRQVWWLCWTTTMKKGDVMPNYLDMNSDLKLNSTYNNNNWQVQSLGKTIAVFMFCLQSVSCQMSDCCWPFIARFDFSTDNEIVFVFMYLC